MNDLRIMITGAQCRAARGFLAWSQDDLAARSSVSRHTVRLFEDGGRTYATTVQKIEEALEAGGVAFMITGQGPAVILLDAASATPD